LQSRDGTEENMENENRDQPPHTEMPPGTPNVGDELSELAQSFSALGRTMFREGRAVSVELLRSVRGIVDRAREEIERLAGDRPR
jgi:hypothetical protein